MLAALLIVLREVLEAGLVVGIVMAATRGVPGRGPMVSLGIGGGVLGACVVAAFASRISGLFAGGGQEVFNAAVLGLAVVMLAWHNTWMAQHGREIGRRIAANSPRVTRARRQRCARLTMLEKGLTEPACSPPSRSSCASGTFTSDHSDATAN